MITKILGSILVAWCSFVFIMTTYLVFTDEVFSEMRGIEIIILLSLLGIVTGFANILEKKV